MATLVTGYVRLDSGHRAHSRYVGLGRRLLDLCLPTVAFYDGDPAPFDPPTQTEIRPARLDLCWLYQASRTASQPPGRSDKDTVNYCVVQHQKSLWLADAARIAGSHVVWIDFGIFHLTDVKERHVQQLLAKVEQSPPDRITLPGIWPLDGRPTINFLSPAWYVAGGVVVMPPRLADWFHETAMCYATLQLEQSGRTTWEVNTWSAIYRDHPEKFHVYQADHNATLFTGYLS
jgi:hypothetical protein